MMNKWLKTDLHTSSEDSSFGRVVVTILSIVLVFVVSAVLFNLVTDPSNRLVLIGAAVIVFVALILALRGVLLPGRIITPLALFIAFLTINVFGGGNGIFDAAMIGMAGIVILAGLLLGRQGVLAFGALVTASIFLMGILDSLGIYSPPRPTATEPADIGVIVVVTLANGALVYLLIQRLTEIAQRSRQNEELQIEANRELKELQVSLEERVAERTRDLERRSLELAIVSEVARDIASIRDMDALLNLSVNLIRERFNYYHTGVFLIDERGEYAVLRAASSLAARAMLEQNHKLRVGAEGIVGYVASTGLPRIALDVGSDAVHFRNPLLPETHSEVGIPLRSRGLTIGVLDIQTTQTSAFNQKDVETLQLLSDQLVVAIENAQLVQRVETTIKELNDTVQAQTRVVWRTAIQQRSDTALEYDGMQFKQIAPQLSADIMHDLEHRQTVILTNGNTPDQNHLDSGAGTLVIPLMIVNQVVGMIGLEKEDPAHIWTEEEISIARAAADRAAIALENARLLQEAQKRATKERVISEISTKISSLVDLDNIVETTINELSRSMPDAEVAIQFHREHG